MSLEANKAVARRQIEEVWNEGKLEVVNEIFAIKLTNQGIAQSNGWDHIKYVIQLWRTAFPDYHATIENAVAEGEFVAQSVTVSGTHTGIFRHPRGTYEPTGKSFKVKQVHLFHIVEGRIVEHQGVRDDFDMFVQLGLMAEVAAQHQPTQ
jgi:predicted ester cyclase